MKYVVTSFLVILSLFVIGQEMTFVTNLSDAITEISGLVEHEGKYYGHNDSGDEAILYEINIENGMVIRQIEITNAINVDWEDLCTDQDFLYIGDFGNNMGSRTDLKIYKVALDSIALNDSANAENIEFYYSDQDDFTPSSFSTNYDAEALISLGDSLYIFTKNWGNFHTHIYSVSTAPGSYSLERIHELNSQGLITGACYNSELDKVVLTGNFLSPFIVELDQFESSDFSGGVLNRYNVLASESEQIEAIEWVGNDNYLIGAEQTTNESASLYSLSGMDSSKVIENLDEPELFHPNPVDKEIKITCQDLIEVKIFDIEGKEMIISRENTTDISELENGMYLMEINCNGNSEIYRFIKQKE